MLISALQVKRAVARRDHVFRIDVTEVLESVVDGKAADADQGVTQTCNNAPPDWKHKLNAVLSKFPDVVPESDDILPGYPPKRVVDHKIELKPGSVPPNKPAYRMSPAELAELKSHLTDLLDRGFIRPSTSPFASPVILVKKKNTTKMRLCVDYRALNSQTIRNAYALPRIDDCLDKLYGMKVFTKLDLQNAYHNVRIAEEDVPKTAF
jgi:hypothetical protein